MDDSENQPTASQSGRSRRRGQGATPVPKPTPSKRSSQTVAKTTISTPTTRRTRQSLARPDQLKDAVANPALPEIPTRSSYAYGSTNAPTLPQQLHARETMSLRQVAEQMDTDINRAQKNLGEHLSHQDDLRTRSQDPTNAQPDLYPAIVPLTQGVQHAAASQQGRHVTPASHTTELRKQQRTAAWASSLDESLGDILEEPSLTGTPETRRTDPSSFPDIQIDHSYAYERGMRAPRVEPIARPPPRVVPAIQKVHHETVALWTEIKQILSRIWKELQYRIRRMTQATIAAMHRLPRSTLLQILLKSFFIFGLTSLLTMSVCLVYKNHLCDPFSTTRFSGVVQSLCGSCTNTGSGYVSWIWPKNSNITAQEFQVNIQKLTTTLNNINNKINTLETRLIQRIDMKHTTVQSEMDGLRRQQGDLTRLLENLRHSESDGSSSGDGVVASPMISRMNYFAPANGAVINPWQTSPTRTRVPMLPVRVFLSIFGMKRYTVNGPSKALKPWHDVGDCWCASASIPGQDSIRLGVSVRELMYPVELVIEHSPTGTTFTPNTAPKEIELWADVSHLSDPEYKTLNIDNMRVDTLGVKDPLTNPNTKSNAYVNRNAGPDYTSDWTNTWSWSWNKDPNAAPAAAALTKQITDRTPVWAKYATVEYDASSSPSSSSSKRSSTSPRNKPHVQSFKLDVNRFGELKYTAQNFVVRVRTNHGAEYGCLYRVRLHGVPVVNDLHDGQDTDARADGAGDGNDYDNDENDFFG